VTVRGGTPHVNFRVGAALAPALEERRRPYEAWGSTAKRDLERYYRLISHELAALDLTVREASLICDALNGVWLMDEAEAGEASIMLAWAEVSDAVRWGDAASHHGLTDEEAHDLIERLREMTPGQRYALVDAVERWWVRGVPDETMTIDESLRAVGLVR
jgi:hypothetical protein